MRKKIALVAVGLALLALPSSAAAAPPDDGPASCQGKLSAAFAQAQQRDDLNSPGQGQQVRENAKRRGTPIECLFG